MKTHRLIGWIACVTSFLPCLGLAKDRPTDSKSIPSGIVWHGVLTDGIAEAKALDKPIMLISAAPQCAGVPGMW